MEREVIKITEFKYDFVAGSYGAPMWGSIVHYKNRGGTRTTKTFEHMDPIQAFAAFRHHCEKLDRDYARKQERLLAAWSRRNG